MKRRRGCLQTVFMAVLYNGNMIRVVSLMLFGSLVLGGLPLPAAAQVGQTPSRLRVFLDCGGCFQDYLRDEIDLVDFVQRREDADVHVLSSSQSTGGGGRETVLRFVGIGRFVGVDDELRAISVSGDTESTRRDIMLRTVTVGLLRYLARGGLPTGVEIDVSVPRPTAGSDASRPQDDPWNAWVFSISGNASINNDERTRERSMNVNLSADRETEDWKMSAGARWEQETEEFDLDEDEPLHVTTQERSVDWFVARGAGPHWSYGLDGRAESSTFGNTKFSLEIAPTVEYSVFPYSEYATRRLRVQYSVGVARAEYNEITLFGVLEETHPRHEASIDFDRSEPWGSLDLGFDFSQFLHDGGKYRIEVDGELSFQISRGLELDIEGSASRIRDQLSIPRRDASSEEVLLRLRELQSGFDVRLEVGLTYRFGSIFNNVVNPRFGR